MTEKLAAAELPPPREGFEATKLTICPDASADAGTTTCKLVALMYFDCSGHSESRLWTRYNQSRRSSRSAKGAPATTLPGEMDNMVGAGFTAGVVGGEVGGAGV